MAKADDVDLRHGVEIRAPFPDQAVVGFATTLPLHARIHGFTTKVFSMHYATRYLSLSTLYRRKRGLSVPLALLTLTRSCPRHMVIDHAKRMV